MKRVLLEVLDITPTTVCRRLDRAAEGCDKVNENLMKDVNVSKIEMDEIWVIVQ